MSILNKDNRYKWTFDNVGGSSRVRISRGEDIKHLRELDPKMWTVLSCPVNGLEIDEKSLAYIDSDSDGKIRVNDIIATAEWITSAVKNADLLLAGNDSMDIDQFSDSELGRTLYNSAKQILENLSKDGNTISLSDTADSAAIFSKTRFNGDAVITEASSEDADEQKAIAAAVASLGGVADRSGVQGVNADIINAFYAALADYTAWVAAAPAHPFGDNTEAVIAAYNALDAKVKDFFMRSKLASFSPDSAAALDVQTSRIESISAEDLSAKIDDIAAYPVARVTGKAEIDLSKSLNPAWAAKFDVIRPVIEGDLLTEAKWNDLAARFAEYASWKSSKAGACVEGLGLEAVKEILAKDKKQALLDLVAQDALLAAEATNIDMVDKFLHIYRDFYRLLRNFVTLNDFYQKDKGVSAVFQSGRLIIDQRECRLCMRVTDMAKHTASASTSEMFLIYCDCTSKVSDKTLNIVAAVTAGEVGDLIVGKNAVYYDNAGNEWDAVISKVIDNPISVGQAFWSPYRRMSKTIENLINKSAADKDAKMMNEANAKINAVPVSLPAAGQDGKPAAAPPFDIAKFAGIFAAIGVAMGMIGAALSGLVDSLKGMQWYQLILLFAGIMLLISGPSMVMACIKLRRRNIAPLLNANGWAVNAASKISIPFGETLTDKAKFPKMKLKDPYRKGLEPWKKVIISLFCLLVVCAALWLFDILAFIGLPSLL